MIGISGKKCTGKTTLSNFLCENYNYKAFAFADFLKKMCSEIFEIDPVDIEDPIRKELRFKAPRLCSYTHLVKVVEYIKNNTPFYQEPIDYYCKKLQGGPPLDFTSIRHILQFIGTDILRNRIDPIFHVRATLDSIKKSGTPLDKVIIHDCRFPNEREMIRIHNGTLVLIQEYTQLRDSDSQKDSHQSENVLGTYKDYDIVLLNDKRRGIDWFNQMAETYKEFRN